MTEGHKSDVQKRDEVLKRMLQTPPKPHTPAEKPAPLKSGDYFIVRDGRMLVARVTSRSGDGSITADLYRNLGDYRAGHVMEPAFRFWP